MERRAKWAAVAAVIVALSTLAGSGSPDPVAHVVRAGDGGGFGVGILKTSPHQPYTQGGLVLCLDRPGDAVVTAVAPVDPTGGLTVDAYLVVPNPFELHGMTSEVQPGTIADLPARIRSGAGRTVDHRCPADDAPRISGVARTKMLYVEFSKPTEATAGDRGIAIEYTSGGRTFTYLTPWFITLCGDDGSAACRG